MKKGSALQVEVESIHELYRQIFADTHPATLRALWVTLTRSSDAPLAESESQVLKFAQERP